MNERFDQHPSRRAAIAVYGGLALLFAGAAVTLSMNEALRSRWRDVWSRRYAESASTESLPNARAKAIATVDSFNPVRSRSESKPPKRLGEVSGFGPTQDFRSSSAEVVHFSENGTPVILDPVRVAGYPTFAQESIRGPNDDAFSSQSTLPAEPVVAPLASNPVIDVLQSPSVEVIELPPTSQGESTIVPQPSAADSTASSPSTLSDSPLVAAPTPIVERFDRFARAGTITLADVRVMALRNNKDIAVIEQAPEISAAAVQSEAAVFDPVFNIALQGGRYYRQVATQIQGFGITSNVLQTSFWQPLNGLNQVYLEKSFVTGGKMQFGLGQNFLRYNPVGNLVLVNPSFQASFNLMLEQPLFRGRGPTATTAQVRIAQANLQQSRHAFRAMVNQVLRDAEAAYWETYAAFQEFEARDASFARARQTVERERGRLQLGEGSIPDVAQAEEQGEMFRIVRAEAETRCAIAQRNLRRLMGVAPDDPRPIIPATTPADAPLELDLVYAEYEARNRPEFAAQESVVAAAEAELARRRNGLLPDVSARAIYSATGLDNHLDEAFSTASTAHYQDWTAGIVYRQPLGRRNDRALADRAVAALAMESARLRRLEHEIRYQLQSAYENVRSSQQMLQLHARRREAAALQLEARRELYLENRAALRDQLEAELRYSAAVYDEATARVTYQRALTEWNYARGALGDGQIDLGT